MYNPPKKVTGNAGKDFEKKKLQYVFSFCNSNCNVSYRRNRRIGFWNLDLKSLIK